MNLRKDHYRFVVSNNAHCWTHSENLRQLSSWTGLFSRGLSAVSQRLGVPGLAGPQGGFRSLLRGSLGRAGPTLEWGRRPPRRTHPAGDSRCLASLGARAGDGSKSLRVLKSSPPPWLFFFVTYRITHLWLNESEFRSLRCRQPSLVGARSSL